MHSAKTLTDFVRISRYLGNDAAYVQGGGGNTSAKFWRRRMLVKASGLPLSAVTETFGYADVDYAQIREYLNAPSDDENEFNAAVISTNSSDGYRPSMETGFHAVLDGFVLHSHSVYANVLTCVEEGAAIIAEHFPEWAWVSYAAPGRELTLSISKMVDAHVFLLQNHGLIVRAETADAVMEAHEKVNAAIRHRLGLDAGFRVEDIVLRPRAFIDAHLLFPDQVIYTNPSSKFDGTRELRETLAAYSYIHARLDERGLTPHYLTQMDADFLLGMNSEKFRGQVARK